MYNFKNCRLGDILYYNNSQGYNLIDGAVVGECCIEAGQIDNYPRFWSKQDHGVSKWMAKTTDKSIIESLSNFAADIKSVTYNHFGSWKNDINGYNNTKILKESNSPLSSKCEKHTYIPSAGELHQAAINQKLLNYKLSNTVYWTSTNFDSVIEHACILGQDGQIMPYNCNQMAKVRTFINIDNTLNEALDLLSIDDDDVFDKSQNKSTEQIVTNHIFDIADRMSSQEFTNMIYEYLDKDISMRGFKFDNEQFGHSVYIKLNDHATNIMDKLEINLKSNGWKNVLNSFSYTGDYLKMIYHYGITDPDKQAAYLQKVSSRITIDDIQKNIQKDKNLNIATQLYQLFYDVYAYKFPKIQNDKLYSGTEHIIHDIHLSQDNSLFAISVQNYSWTHDEFFNDKDYVIIGLTGMSTPNIPNNKSSRLDNKKIKEVKQEIEKSIQEIKSENESCKIPSSFTFSVKDGHVIGETNIIYDMMLPYDMSSRFMWDKVVCMQFIKNKNLKNFLHDLDLSSMYINSAQTRDNIIIHNEHIGNILPSCIKMPLNNNFLYAAYYVDAGIGQKYVKVVIYDNRDEYYGNRHDLINHLTLTSKWTGYYY